MPAPLSSDQSATRNSQSAINPDPPQPTAGALRRVFGFLGSLKLTVILLAAAMWLVFIGTLAQQQADIYSIQQRYFHSFKVVLYWVSLPQFFSPLALPLPVPGGYLIGSLLLLNLLAAHALRLKVIGGIWRLVLGLLVALAAVNSLIGLLAAQRAIERLGAAFTVLLALGLLVCALWLAASVLLFGRRCGMVLIHSGIILLLLGDLATSLLAVESQVTLNEGQTKSYTEDVREMELAILAPAAEPNLDAVTAVPEALLQRRGLVQDARLPFDVRLVEWFPNSDLVHVGEGGVQAGADQGYGLEWTPLSRPLQTNSEQINIPSAVIALERQGQRLGTFVVSLYLSDQPPQEVQVGGRTYRISLRARRYYKPYSLTLQQFITENYTGTDTPKTFLSHVRVVDARSRVDLEYPIYMNHPLRYAGETFYQYQASTSPQGNRTSTLQVVDNPGSLVPYISCTLVTLGMMVHFVLALVRFLWRAAA